MFIELWTLNLGQRSFLVKDSILIVVGKKQWLLYSITKVSKIHIKAKIIDYTLIKKKCWLI